METFSELLAICVGNSSVTSEFPAQRPVSQTYDIFIRYWINGWVNNREAADSRRYRVHYDVIIIILLCIFKPNIRKSGQKLREPIRFE